MSKSFEKTAMANNLTRFRKSNGYTQEQVAEILKIKRSTYAYYERSVTPPYDIIQKLALLYNVTAYQLMYGMRDPVEESEEQRFNRSVSNTLHDDFNIFTDPSRMVTYASLTEKERKLIANYRLLPPLYKEKLLAMAEEFSSKVD